MSEIKTS